MLKPSEIQNKEFEIKLRGYDRDQVDDFLDVIIGDYAALGKEIKNLREKVTQLTDEIERYKAIETTMKNALEVARTSGEELRQKAEMEANAVVQEARVKAERLSKQIDDEHLKTHKEMLAMKTEVAAYKAKMKGICATLMEMLDQIDG